MKIRRALTSALAFGMIGLGTTRGLAAASSTAVTFTGRVASDFAATPGSGVYVLPGEAQNGVAQASWITQSGWTNGWVMKDMRFHYNQTSDQMQVGINFYSIAGNADGNGTPGIPDPRLTAAGGIDPAGLAGRKSITVAFAPDSPNSNSQPGTPIILAGVPQDKSQAGSGIDGFTVATYKPVGGIENSYGVAVPGTNGGLAFDPTAAHPGFEFTINNFSKIPGLDPTKGFWVQSYAGSPDDVVAGEGQINWSRIPAIAAQTIPEPTTVVSWIAIGLAAAIETRRARRDERRA